MHKRFSKSIQLRSIKMTAQFLAYNHNITRIGASKKELCDYLLLSIPHIIINSHLAGTVLVVPSSQGWQLFRSVSVWSNSCGVRTRTPVPGSVLWWTRCAPSWACCSCLTYSSRPGALKWKTEHFPATADSLKKKKKVVGEGGKWLWPIWKQSKLKARQLEVPIILYCAADIDAVCSSSKGSKYIVADNLIQRGCQMYCFKSFSHNTVKGEFFYFVLYSKSWCWATS